jgi:hypothetical protein
MPIKLTLLGHVLRGALIVTKMNLSCGVDTVADSLIEPLLCFSMIPDDWSMARSSNDTYIDRPELLPSAEGIKRISRIGMKGLNKNSHCEIEELESRRSRV